MSGHNRKEREAVSRAYSTLEYMTRAHDMTAGYKLEYALKHERRERSSLVDAKALLVQCAHEDTGARAGELYHMALGCSLAAMIGAEFKKNFRDRKRWLQFAREAKAAKIAHRKALDRSLGNI